jgi:hypothetical protein
MASCSEQVTFIIWVEALKAEHPLDATVRAIIPTAANLLIVITNLLSIMFSLPLDRKAPQEGHRTGNSIALPRGGKIHPS